ncbi:hypothetical protein UYSO10_0459 [Kosakonia radicincitans]|nr:hypothetical protein UYSO10_0459 [Kosakonia radicincitans]
MQNKKAVFAALSGKISVTICVRMRSGSKKGWKWVQQVT